ncbi:MAG TPA: substrate-binding domain-containing protein [Stellaceae bacterium]|jgi:molybdate transport system substrate-binding protein|nr:substrate-binding domain-containing protein [Stellaceae bacterium]
MRTGGLLLLALFCLALMTGTATADTVHVLAAGSLREVMAAIGDRYQQQTATAISGAFGPSGLLRERIEKGEHADLFASADMGQPLQLQSEGRAVRVVMFTRNKLCGFATQKVGLTTANFVDGLLDPAVKLGTSTPKADPGGDYTWAMFHRIDALRPGSYAILDKKAQQVVGGPTNNAPVGGKGPVVAAFANGRIDIFIGYCSGAKRLQSQMPELQAAEVSHAIATGPEYGLAVLKGADPRTPDLALFMLSPDGQQIFAQHGFSPVTLPAPGH